MTTTGKPTIVKKDSSRYLNEISREYGLYVLHDRSFPAMTDGLKSSQRIALWLIRNRDSEIKTVSLAGEMISSKLYVHGDASAAGTINYLAAPYLNNHPLIQGEGQFGSRSAPITGIGAPRYTEVKRSAFAKEHLYLDLDILPMVENYDGSVLMPGTFLPLLPLVLLNGVRGVGIGWSTTILPRRLSDLQKAVQEVLEHGRVLTPLLPHYERYDVEILRDHANSKKFIIRGKLEIKNTSTVLITELPPDLSLEKFKEYLIGLENDGKIKDYTDRTTNRINIEIKMSRAELERHTESSLIELFKLRSFCTENLVMLNPEGAGGVRVFDTPEEVVQEFVEWRLGWFKRRYEVMVEKEIESALLWETFTACFPKVAKSIATYTSKNHLRKAVYEAANEKGIEPTEEIVEKIISFPVHRWTVEGRDEAKAKLAESKRNVIEYTKIVNSPERQKAIYLSEVVD